MSTDKWAPYLRLQEQYRACRDAGTAKAIEGAMDRELESLAKGAPRNGTVQTAMSNHRRRERQRARLETMAAPLMMGESNPWPKVDERLDLSRQLERLGDAMSAVVVGLITGHTYAELATARRCPVGTLKAQVHRARSKLAA